MGRLGSISRPVGVLLAVAVALSATTAVAWGRTIHGSHRSDVLKGTNGADVIDGNRGNDILIGLGGSDRLSGGRGNDRLYAGEGNDRLSGGRGNDKLAAGPGADVISCGRGRDVVYADAADKVAKDCENVHRSVPPPTVAGPVAGVYRGDTVSFEVSSDAKNVANLRLDYTGPCQPQGTTHVTINNSGPWSIQADRTFAVESADGATKLELKGAFDQPGGASGTFSVQTSVDVPGAKVTCDTGTVSWTARSQTLRFASP